MVRRPLVLRVCGWVLWRSWGGLVRGGRGRRKEEKRGEKRRKEEKKEKGRKEKERKGKERKEKEKKRKEKEKKKKRKRKEKEKKQTSFKPNVRKRPKVEPYTAVLANIDIVICTNFFIYQLHSKDCINCLTGGLGGIFEGGVVGEEERRGWENEKEKKEEEKCLEVVDGLFHKKRTSLSKLFLLIQKITQKGAWPQKN